MADVLSRKVVFISYGREGEVTDFVLKLATDLERGGFPVWLDQKDIPAGSDWHEVIGNGLHNCQALIAVITRKYVDSRFCKSELYTADGDGKLIFPVFYEDVDLSVSERSRGIKYVISGINWTMFRPQKDVYDESLQKLFSGLLNRGLGNSSTVTELFKQKEKEADLPSSGPLGDAPPPYTALYSQVPPQVPAPAPLPPPFPMPQSTEYSPHQHGPALPAVFHHSNPVFSDQSGGQATLFYCVYGHSCDCLCIQCQQCYHYQYQYPSLSGPAPSAPPQEKVGFTSEFNEFDASHTVDGTINTLAELSFSEAETFTDGMHLEARDRKHPSMVCVATISQIRDGFLLIHFDGWTEKYDYWCEPSSQDIHPIGWCKEHCYRLQSPKNMVKEFYWEEYLRMAGGIAAPKKLFTLEQIAVGPPSPLKLATSSCAEYSGIEPGMHLEAKDRQHPTLVCVATVARIQGNRLLIHFDGWPDEYDYWCEASSEDIHPVGWCRDNKHNIQPPNGMSDDDFSWEMYLTSTGSIAVPKKHFSKAQLVAPSPSKSSHPFYGDFRPGMRLEAVDRKHPSVICVATVAEVRGDQLRIHFDGWSSEYDYWCSKTTTDIHPIGWCQRTNRRIRRPSDGSFITWPKYLSTLGAHAVPESLFLPNQCLLPTFQLGMKLEAKDVQNPSLICVATVVAIDEDKLKIHFDGWSDKYDYWCNKTNTNIHPSGWCENHSRKLQSPKGMPGKFIWETYLNSSSAVAAPRYLFTDSQQ